MINKTYTLYVKDIINLDSVNKTNPISDLVKLLVIVNLLKEVKWMT